MSAFSQKQYSWSHSVCEQILFQDCNSSGQVIRVSAIFSNSSHVTLRVKTGTHVFDIDSIGLIKMDNIIYNGNNYTDGNVTIKLTRSGLLIKASIENITVVSAEVSIGVKGKMSLWAEKSFVPFLCGVCTVSGKYPDFSSYAIGTETCTGLAPPVLIRKDFNFTFTDIEYTFRPDMLVEVIQNVEDSFIAFVTKIDFMQNVSMSTRVVQFHVLYEVGIYTFSLNEITAGKALNAAFGYPATLYNGTILPCNMPMIPVVCIPLNPLVRDTFIYQVCEQLGVDMYYFYLACMESKCFHTDENATCSVLEALNTVCIDAIRDVNRTNVNLPEPADSACYSGQNSSDFVGFTDCFNRDRRYCPAIPEFFTHLTCQVVPVASAGVAISPLLKYTFGEYQVEPTYVASQFDCEYMLLKLLVPNFRNAYDKIEMQIALGAEGSIKVAVMTIAGINIYGVNSSANYTDQWVNLFFTGSILNVKVHRHVYSSAEGLCKMYNKTLATYIVSDRLFSGDAPVCTANSTLEVLTETSSSTSSTLTTTGSDDNEQIRILVFSLVAAVTGICLMCCGCFLYRRKSKKATGFGIPKHVQFIYTL